MAAYTCAGIDDQFPGNGVYQIHATIKQNKVTDPQIGDLAIWCNGDNWHADTNTCDIPNDNEPSNHVGIYIRDGKIAACNGYKKSGSKWIPTEGVCGDNKGDKTCPQITSISYSADAPIYDDKGTKFTSRIFLGYFRPNFK